MSDWEESIRARLFERRVVLVSGPLEEQVAGQAAMELMTLDASGDGAIHLQVDSADGSLEAALSLMDVVQLTGVPVRATCIGLVGGPAVGLFAVCHHRMVTPHGRFRLAEPAATFRGSARDIEQWAEDRRARRELFCERLGSAVGKPVDQVLADLGAGRYLSAEEAVTYGLVDEICRPEAEIYRLPARPMGFQP